MRTNETANFGGVKKARCDRPTGKRRAGYGRRAEMGAADYSRIRVSTAEIAAGRPARSSAAAGVIDKVGAGEGRNRNQHRDREYELAPAHLLRLLLGHVDG